MEYQFVISCRTPFQLNIDIPIPSLLENIWHSSKSIIESWTKRKIHWTNVFCYLYWFFNETPKQLLLANDKNIKILIDSRQKDFFLFEKHLPFTNDIRNNPKKKNLWTMAKHNSLQFSWFFVRHRIIIEAQTLKEHISFSHRSSISFNFNVLLHSLLNIHPEIHCFAIWIHTWDKSFVFNIQEIDFMILNRFESKIRWFSRMAEQIWTKN